MWNNALSRRCHSSLRIQHHRVGDLEARVDLLRRGIRAGLVDRVRREVDASTSVTERGQQDGVLATAAAPRPAPGADHPGLLECDDCPAAVPPITHEERRLVRPFKSPSLLWS